MCTRENEHLRRQVGALRERLKETRETLHAVVQRLEKLEAERQVDAG